MEHDIDEMLDNSPLKMYSSTLASQDKMIIRIKKKETEIDIEGKSSDSDESIYTCEFVQKDNETKSEFDDSSDEPETIEAVRQDENFIYPVITDSDKEDMDDVTWQPSVNSEERMSRKQVKCLYSKKKTDKSNGTVKRLKKDYLLKTNKVLEDIDVSKFDTQKPTSNLITKKICNSLTPKVYKPKKGLATPKQRLGRIIKIHKMMK